MSEEIQNEIIDLDFNMDDPTLQLERPILKEAVLEFLIAKTGTKPTKDGKGKLLVVELKTTTPAETTTGKTVNPGIVVFDQMVLQDSGKMTPGQWRERPGKLHLAATGDKSGKPNTGQWQGQTVKAKVVVRKEQFDEASGKTYPEKNEISFYYPKSV